jgi:hypothetical protein
VTDTAPADAGAANEALSWPSADEITDEVFEETAEPEATDESAEETTEEAPAEETTEEPAEEPEPEGEKPEVFDRDYVEKLRDQAAGYRVQAKEFHEAFEGYDEAATAKFLDLAKGLNDETRHEDVAREFLTIGKRILTSLGKEVGDDFSTPDPNRPLTLAELEKREAAQAEERQMAEIVEKLDQEITGLGYTTGSPDHYALMRLANDREDGSIEKAHEALQEWKKGIINEWASSFKQKQDKHLKTTPAVGVAPKDAGEEPDLSWEGSRNRLDQYLEDMQST